MNDSDWPTYVPYFYPCMISKDPESYGGSDFKKTAMGWLLSLFLIEPDYGMAIKKNFTKAEDALKRHATGWKKHVCLEEWESAPKISEEKIAKALNETMKELGYTEHYYTEYYYVED